MEAVPRKWERAVSREGICHASICKHSGAAREELDEDDEEPHHCAACSSACVEKYLSSWHSGGTRDNRIEVVNAEAEGNRQHPSDDSGYRDRMSDGHGASNGCIMGLF